MLADVPQMTWFVNIKMLLWRLVDKMDGRALTPQSSGFGLALLLPGAAFSGVRTHVPSPLSFATLSLRSRAPRLTPRKQPSAGPGAEAHRDRMSGPVKVFGHHTMSDLSP
jgi:hypothetical protein